MSKITDFKTEWDLSVFYENVRDPRIDIDAKEFEKDYADFADLLKCDKSYLQDANKLALVLEKEEALSLKHYGKSGRPACFFWLCKELNDKNEYVKTKYNQFDDLNTKVINNIAFFEIELSKISSEKQTEFLQSKELFKYRYVLSRLFEESKHILSEKEEKILNLFSKPAYGSWVDVTSEALSKEERKLNGNKLGLEGLISALDTKDKKTRKASALAINDIFRKHVATGVAELNSVLYFKKTNDELRGFEDAEASTLLSEDIDHKIMESILSSVESRFNISKRWYSVKAKYHGLKKIAYYEKGLSFSSTAESKEYSLSDAVNVVGEVLLDLDQEFFSVYKNMLENGRFDFLPRKDKSGGGFCIAFEKDSPIFIFMNYTNKTHDVLTIAHEMGHALNDHFMSKMLSPSDFGVSLVTAEVASTFFEDFVLEKLFRSVSKEEKLQLLGNKIDNLIASIQRQISCYLFERDLHSQFREKNYLSETEIGNLFKKHMQAYLGDSVKMESGSENWWLHWSHIRRFFYVFSYASSQLISMSLQEKVREDKAFILKIKDFLGKGKSKSPKDIFLDLGIDISDKDFWQLGLNKLERYIDDFEKLLKELQ